jgi:hypothetical protein
LFQGTLLTYFFFKIFLNAPQDLKFHSFVCLIGAIIVSIIPGVLYLFGLTMLFPGCSVFLFGIGTLLISIALVFQPKLAYILPFKLYHLIVIETKSGLPLYKYSWKLGTKLGEINPPIFSSLLHGIDLFMENSINRGNIQEIWVEEAMLMVSQIKEIPISCVLITSKPSLVLRKALDCFYKRFYKKFAQLIKNPSNLSKFNSAKQIVEECFAFIPY